MKMRDKTILLVIITIGFCLISLNQAAYGSDKINSPGPYVSITFDDGWLSAFRYAIPIMDKYGFRGTHFIHAEYVDKPGYQSDYMTSAQLKELYSKGHEIGSHALNTEWASIISDPKKVEEHLVRSRDILNGFGFNTVGFAPPNGAFNPEVKEQIKSKYRYMRTIIWGPNNNILEPYNLHCYIVTNKTTLEDITKWVEQAKRYDAWVILLYHRFDATRKADTFVTPQRFEEDVNYLSTIHAKVLPIGEVLGVWKPFSHAE